jgi:hypothetical protein
MFKPIYVAATIVDGVYKIDPEDFPELELITVIDFIYYLSSLEGRERIFTCFTENEKSLYEKVSKEYGIN